MGGFAPVALSAMSHQLKALYLANVAGDAINGDNLSETAISIREKN